MTSPTELVGVTCDFDAEGSPCYLWTGHDGPHLPGVGFTCVDVPVIDGIATLPDGRTVTSAAQVLRVAVADALPPLPDVDDEHSDDWLDGYEQGWADAVKARKDD